MNSKRKTLGLRVWDKNLQLGREGQGIIEGGEGIEAVFPKLFKAVAAVNASQSEDVLSTGL
jgi:hypothetical protein